MRWKLLSAIPACLLLLLATGVHAQTIPVTVTLLPGPGQPVTGVEFPDINEGHVFPQDPNTRIQHYVGDMTGPPVDGRYLIRATLYIGGSVRPTQIFSFQADDHCTDNDDNEGTIVRVSCAAVEHGAGFVCHAIYDGMEDPPRPTCKGTTACKMCPPRIRVCGSKPECF